MTKQRAAITAGVIASWTLAAFACWWVIPFEPNVPFLLAILLCYMVAAGLPTIVGAVIVMVQVTVWAIECWIADRGKE